jgi:hypothetical protein
VVGSRQGTPEASEGSHSPGLDGAESSERLTAMTGAVLLVGLAIECYTILRIGRLLTLHVFLGMLLLGPVVLKAGSVLYRFVRYYTGSEPYRRKGPPALLPRVIGPIIMLLTACVFGSGIMLAVTGPGYGPPGGWLEVHRISFIAWAFFIVIHVLTYVPRVPRLLAAEAHGGPLLGFLGGRGTRLGLMVASLLAGLVIALLTVHLAGKWESFGVLLAGRASATAVRRSARPPVLRRAMAICAE